MAFRAEARARPSDDYVLPGLPAFKAFESGELDAWAL